MNLLVCDQIFWKALQASHDLIMLPIMLLISYYFLEKIKKRHFHEYQFIAAQNIYVKKELETMVLPITVLTHIFNIL